MEATNSVGKSVHSAGDSLVGYLYQCRVALFEMLKKLQAEPDIVLGLETLDDVVFERDGSPTEVIQIKHRTAKKANLTDSSSDLWKSIKIWLDLNTEKASEDNTIYCLMTTSSVLQGSAASYLSTMNAVRDVDQAIKSLSQIAQSSTNKEHSCVYQKFLFLSDNEKVELFKSVYVIDNCPIIENLEKHIKEVLFFSCKRELVDQLFNYLEGWWFQRIIKGLRDREFQLIRGLEVESHINYLREKLKPDALPIHPEIQEAIPKTDVYSDYDFIRQLDLINAKKSTLLRAVENFYKASTQSSRWVREELLLNNELENYDKKIKNEWEIKFDQTCEKYSKGDQIQAGKEIYNWIEQANFPIRPSCDEYFITRGSYHMLSNQLKIGWHPNFRQELMPKSGETEC